MINHLHWIGIMAFWTSFFSFLPLTVIHSFETLQVNPPFLQEEELQLCFFSPVVRMSWKRLDRYGFMGQNQSSRRLRRRPQAIWLDSTFTWGFNWINETRQDGKHAQGLCIYNTQVSVKMRWWEICILILSLIPLHFLHINFWLCTHHNIYGNFYVEDDVVTSFFALFTQMCHKTSPFKPPLIPLVGHKER